MRQCSRFTPRGISQYWAFAHDRMVVASTAVAHGAGEQHDPFHFDAGEDQLAEAACC